MAQAATLRRTPDYSAHAREARTTSRLLTFGLPIGLLALALVLRVHDLAHQSLWLDEGYTLLFSRMPLDRLFLVGGAHEHPPLYYLLVHLTLGVHDSYLVPRALSVLFGSLTVVAVFRLGVRLGGFVAGSVAALLVAVSPLQVFYSQDGRGYALAGLLVVLSYLALFRAVDDSKWAAWALYGVCIALTLYAEYTAVLALTPQLLLLTQAWRAGQRRPVAFSLLGSAIAFAPWVGTLALDTYNIVGDYWIPNPSPGAFANTLLEFVGFLTPCNATPCAGHEAGIPLLSGNEIAFAAILACIVALVAVVALVRRRNVGAVLALWLLVPFVIVLMLVPVRSLYLDRVFVDASFPLFLLLGLGSAALLGRAPIGWSPSLRQGGAWMGVAALVVTLVVGASSVAQLQPIYASQSNPDWKTLGRDLASAYRPGDSVVFNPGVLRPLVDSYLPSGWHASREVALWSRVYVDVPGWQNRYHVPSHPSKAQRSAIEARLRNLQLASVARGERAVWLVTYDYPGLNDTRRWFTDHGFQNVISELYPGDTRLELWSRDAPGAIGRRMVLNDGMGVGWIRRGRLRDSGRSVVADGSTTLARSFPVVPGKPYSLTVDFRGLPPASKPGVALQVRDRSGRVLGEFPRTMWYDWPVNGVWLSQPFGFVAPPGSRTATLTLSTGWGESEWRNIAVYALR
jgi:hypothetical protein